MIFVFAWPADALMTSHGRENIAYRPIHILLGPRTKDNTQLRVLLVSGYSRNKSSRSHLFVQAIPT